mmetsp:Transcript_25062/g.69846  ORF Transcript_25062/g.69846 Transcript_25062/m.69846 type:complete len:252 (+) Transcript_25062:904-1659(+)
MLVIGAARHGGLEHAHERALVLCQLFRRRHFATILMNSQGMRRPSTPLVVVAPLLLFLFLFLLLLVLPLLGRRMRCPLMRSSSLSICCILCGLGLRRARIRNRTGFFHCCLLCGKGMRRPLSRVRILCGLAECCHLLGRGLRRDRCRNRVIRSFFQYRLKRDIFGVINVLIVRQLGRVICLYCVLLLCVFSLCERQYVSLWGLRRLCPLLERVGFRRLTGAFILPPAVRERPGRLTHALCFPGRCFINCGR